MRIALPLTLCLAMLGAPSLCAQDEVSGRILSQLDEHPIPHAQLILTDTRTEREAAKTESSDDGTFRFDAVARGKYRLTATATGYTTASYLAHEQYSTAIVTGAGLTTTGLLLKLAPLASITGTITDGNGDPVQHAQLQVYRDSPTESEHVTRFRSMQADDDGTFELDRLPPGRYFLSVSGSPWYAVPVPLEPDNAQMPFRAAVDPALDVAYPTVFYPQALDSADASPIVLHGGEQLRINFQLTAEHAQTLTLRQEPARTSSDVRFIQPFPQLTRSVFGLEEPVNVGMDGMNDQRRITGIPPGRYDLRQFANGGGVPVTSRSVDLSSGSITMEMPPAPETATVDATIHMLGNSSAHATLLSLRPAGKQGMERTAATRINDKGLAELPNIPAGDYTLMVSGNRAFSIVRLSADGKPLPGTTLHISAPGKSLIDLTVSAAQVRIDGLATHDGKAAVAAMAVLVPAGADTSPELFRRDQADLDGSFTFNGVVPGNYILIALEDAWELPWTDTAILSKYLLHGLPVTIPDTAASPVKLSENIQTQPR